MIIGLILKNYIPLLLKGVSIVQLDTRDMFNIILGRNGHGKTSLLREMSPLPPDNAHYGKGGYKEWKYKDDRGTYVLISETGKSSKHQFIFNGKNLNEGNTLSVQKELVKIHFGITPNIKAILTGLDLRDLFTTMSSQRRKEFLMAINPNDTTFGNKTFNRLKTAYNTIKGGLKTQHQRLAVEENRMNQLASMDVEELRKEISVMDDQLKNALVLHGALSQFNYSEINELKNEINSIISQLISMDSRIKCTKSQYIERREQCLIRLEKTITVNTRLGAILTEITTQLQGFENGTENLEGYELRLKQVCDLVELYQQEKVQAIEFFNYNKIDDSLQPLFEKYGEEFINQLQQVSRAVDLEVTSVSYNNCKEKLIGKQNRYENLQKDIEGINHQLKHFNNAENVNCPECKTDFKLGFEKFNLVEMKDKLNLLANQAQTLSGEIKVLSEYIESNESWYYSMDALMRYVKRQHDSLELVNVIKQFKVGKKDSNILIESIRKSLTIKTLTNQIVQLENEQEQLTAQIKFLKNSDMDALFLRAEDTERELAITQRQIYQTKDEIKEIETCIGLIDHDDFLRDHLAQLILEIKERVENNGKYVLKQKIEEVINDISPRKDQAISGLIRAQSLCSVIESIKENIADLEKREKHLLLLMDGLSPVKGFIGHLMNDFLKSVISNVNAIINPIWSDKLHVLNCQPKKGDDDTIDLDYEFPVITGYDNEVNSDIGDCSGGEREIINFAFRITFLRYLGKHSGIPLLMDEVGVAFDELHRGRFGMWIEEQFRMDKLPQIFMISHYIKQFGLFQNANIIALNTEGLNIGLTVNKQSIIK
ncbi:DNA repair exonuclease SbcCD ATPase subunit [Aeromonas phage AerS_266]|nr:DNA repair exonuclease SbcCD ATPase subunit [Aeromonas phage AerS_266]